MVKRCGPSGLNVRAHQRRGDAAAEVTPVRCKTKQNVMTRLAERSGWLLSYLEMDATMRRAIVAAEK
ncbi:MAG: hypothetical protein JWN98_1817 [Abditibacteriota bacterium]|jgi:hypothetical protein|nr:hypothetical protein [Abditibacteriota bacterium]